MDRIGSLSQSLLSRMVLMARPLLLHASVAALLGTMLLSAPQIAAAQSTPPPLRVAIVGLEHGHVEGFLAQLPKHEDVQLVGIADPDPALQAKYQKKYGLADNLFQELAKLPRQALDRRLFALGQTGPIER